MTKARRRWLAAAVLTVVAAGAAALFFILRRPPPAPDPLARFPVVPLPRTDVFTFTKQVLIPRLAEQTANGVTVTKDVRFGLFRRLTPEGKCAFLREAHVACTDEAAKFYLASWRPRLAGSRARVDADRATLVTSDGETLVARSTELNQLVLNAMFDSGVGLRLADPKAQVSIYLAPFNKSHLREFTIDPQGKFDDKSYDGLCGALEIARDARLYKAIAMTLAGGFDHAGFSELPPASQVLLADVVGIAYAECFVRIMQKSHDARGVQCGDIYSSMMLLGYAIGGGHVIDPTGGKPLLRKLECRWPMARREVTTRLKTGEYVTTYLKEHEAALCADIKAAAGGKGLDVLSDLSAGLERNRLPQSRAAELSGRLFDVLAREGSAIDAWLATQFERGLYTTPRADDAGADGGDEPAGYDGGAPSEPGEP